MADATGLPPRRPLNPDAGTKSPRGSVHLGPLSGVTGALLDLDGCTWFGGRLADGAADFVRDLRAAGVRVGFLTNASIAPGARFAAMLAEAGLPCPADRMLAPLDLVTDDLRAGAARWLAPGAPVLTLAADAVREALAAAGADVREPEPGAPDDPVPAPTDAPAVLLGRDARLCYRDLTVATRTLRAGARLIALNGDARIPAGDGDVVPGPGAIATALGVASGVRPEIVGKPSRAFFDAALARFDMDRAGTVMIGDNPFTDVAGGIDAGLRTVWIDLGTFRDGVAPDGSERPAPDATVGSMTELRALLES